LNIISTDNIKNIKLYLKKKKYNGHLCGHPPIAWLLSDWWAQAGSGVTPSLTLTQASKRARRSRRVYWYVSSVSHLTYLLAYI